MDLLTRTFHRTRPLGSDINFIGEPTRQNRRARSKKVHCFAQKCHARPQLCGVTFVGTYCLYLDSQLVFLAYLCAIHAYSVAVSISVIDWSRHTNSNCKKPWSFPILYAQQHRANVNAYDYCHSTPLHWASGGGHQQVCEALAENGASIDTQDFTGQTAFHWAARHGHLDVCRLLVTFGAGAPGAAPIEPTISHENTAQVIVHRSTSTKINPMSVSSVDQKAALYNNKRGTFHTKKDTSVSFKWTMYCARACAAMALRSSSGQIPNTNSLSFSFLFQLLCTCYTQIDSSVREKTAMMTLRNMGKSLFRKPVPPAMPTLGSVRLGQSAKKIDLPTERQSVLPSVIR
jgi:hypothetical protein